MDINSALTEAGTGVDIEMLKLVHNELLDLWL